MFLPFAKLYVTFTPAFTVTLHVAFLPSFVKAVIVAVPAFLAVTLPFLTVATFVLLEDQVMFLYLAFAGATVAVKVNVALVPTVIFLAFNLTDLTFT